MNFGVRFPSFEYKVNEMSCKMALTAVAIFTIVGRLGRQSPGSYDIAILTWEIEKEASVKT